MQQFKQATSRTLPVLLALGAAIMWGVWWAPIRLLEEAGMQGIWANIVMNFGALPAILLANFLPPYKRSISSRALLGALGMGISITLYGSALAFTEVVRSVLFFYLAPAWSIAIECLFLGRKWTWRSATALALSFSGVITIFQGEISLSGWNIGDIMAVGAGLAWSAGAALVFTTTSPGTHRLALAATAGALLSGGLLALLMDSAIESAPDIAAIVAALPLAFGSGLLYLAPIILITLWSAIRLPPATMSFLLTAEIVSGVGSSTLYLGERFGWVRAAGAILVSLGAIVETAFLPKWRHR